MESEKIFRLMELFNVKIESKTKHTVTARFASESYEDVRKIKVQLIQWIPKGTELPAQVVMPDASVTEGFAEADCKKLKPDAIIQFERFGFVRVNEVGEKIIAYYAHK
jgi:glutamyl-tRNA synthetase